MMSNYFKQWWTAGYKDIIPVVPPGAKLSENSYIRKNSSAGKAPGVKYESGYWGGMPGWREHVTTEADVEAWHSMGASVGLRRGDAFVLDIDAYDEATADQIEQDAIEQLGPAPCRVGQWPKRALLYRADGPIPGVKLIFSGKDDKPNQIETPAQVVVYGKHSSGRHYEWIRKPEAIGDLSPVNAIKLNAFLESQRAKLPKAHRSDTIGNADRERIDQRRLQGNPELVAEAVRRLPNTREHFATYDDMIRVGNAISAALPGDRLLANELWHDWCERWEGGDYDHDLTERRWSTIKPPHAFGAPYLFELADKLAPLEDGKTYQALSFFEEIADEEENPFVQIELNASKEQTDKFKFLNFAEASAGALSYSTRPLIKGLIDQSTMSVVYGDSNVGKTFVTMDISHHVATGTRYAGLKTSAARVVYVAAEGGKGAMKRIMALEEKYGMPGDPSAFLLLPMPLDLRRPDADLNPFIAAMNNLNAPPGLIVVDTLSRALAGGDENSSVDMGAIVKHFDVIRNAMGAHLMVVHHTGKNKAAGARGHSLLRAATDTEIEIAEGTIAVTKQRDLDKSWSSGFSLEVRTLGIDEDLEPITSCTVRLLSKAEVEAEERKGEPTIAEARVLRGLAYILVGSSLRGQGVTLEQLMSSSAEILSGMNAELVRAHLRNLKAKGHVTQPKRGFWGMSEGGLSPAILSDEDNLSEKQPSEKEDFASSELISDRSSASQMEENGRKRNAGIFD
jgi:hypothetical protein